MGGYGGQKMEGHSHTKAVLNRIARAAGHLNAVKAMVEEGRDCTEVLIQLSAVRAEIVGTAKVILKDHMQHCIVTAVKEGAAQALEALNRAIDQYL